MALADFTTVADVKGYAGITGSATDTALQALITGASAFMRSWMNRDLATPPQAYTETLSGRGTFAIQFPQYPAVSVQSLKVDGVAIGAAPSATAAGYRFSETDLVLTGYAFTRGLLNIELAYTAGFASVPADIAAACNELVTLKFRTRDKLEISSKSLAGETVSFTQRDMPASVATLLKNWRKVAPI